MVLDRAVKIYGAERCHKSRYYKEWLKQYKIPFRFYDVEEKEVYADELRSLYENGKLNFPTLVIKGKKLRNPRAYDLEKWLRKKGLL